MNFFYLISIILFITLQNVTKKIYGDKTGGRGTYLFSVLSSFAAMLFFIVTSGKLKWDAGVLPYSFGFAVSYATATVASLIALSSGSLSITTLIISYSLMLPTLYGLIFLKDPISIGLIPGIILLAISLVLINKKSEDAPHISLKWIISVTLAFLCNGLCSVFQKMQQVVYDGAYKNEFMTYALLMVVVMLSFFVFAKETKEVKISLKSGWIFAVVCGLMNAVVNLFVMLLSGKMPASLMFPLISAGGIVLTYIISKFFYKEKLSKLQLTGFILGTASVVLLNI